jgi:hypothetical protein
LASAGTTVTVALQASDSAKSNLHQTRNKAQFHGNVAASA